MLQNKNALERPITASNAIHFGKPFAWTIIYINSRFTTEYERVKLIIFKCKYCVLILYRTNYAAFTILLFLSSSNCSLLRVTAAINDESRRLHSLSSKRYFQKKKKILNIFFFVALTPICF